MEASAGVIQSVLKNGNKKAPISPCGDLKRCFRFEDS